jgi:hypothetical protein
MTKYMILAMIQRLGSGLVAWLILLFLALGLGTLIFVFVAVRAIL